MPRAVPPWAPCRARPTGNGRARQAAKACKNASTSSAWAGSPGSSSWASTSPPTNTGSPSGGGTPRT
eukprot:1629187-Alexandrium_andersonii.AAC.1